MITTLLMLHMLLSVALIGAITHQAFSTARRVPAAERSFVGRFRAVGAAGYTNAVVILFVAASILGALLYPPYRLDVRPTLEVTLTETPAHLRRRMHKDINVALIDTG